MIVRELVTKLSFQADNSAVKRFDQNVGKLRGSLKGATSNLRDMANGIRNTGAALTAFATVPLGLLTGGLIKAASDAEETEAKFGTVFSSIRDEADETAKTLSRDFGLSSQGAQQLLSDTGDLLSGFGFAQKETLQFSKDLNELAVDLASFTNLEGGAERASRSLTKALLGERESIKELGIQISEKDVKERIAINRSKGITRATERQEKALATLQLAQEQSKNSIGDFARTQEGFANQMRILRARISDVAVSFGRILLPVANKVVRVFVKVFERFEKLSKASKTVILLIGGLVAIAGPVLLVLGLFAGAITSLVGLMATLKLAILPIILILGLLAAAVGLVAQDIAVWVMGGNSLLGQMLGNFEDFKNKLIPILKLLRTTFSNFWKGVIRGERDALDEFSKNLEELVPILVKAGLKLGLVAGKIVVAISEELLAIVGRLVFSIFNPLVNALNNFVDDIVTTIKEKFPLLGSFLIGPGQAAPAGTGGASFDPNTISGFSGFNRNVTTNRPVTTIEANFNFTEPTTNPEQFREEFSREMGTLLEQTVNANPRTE